MEYKYGRYCIQNLMLTVIIGQAMVFVANMLVPAIGIVSKLQLVWPLVMQGQVWRLLTFIFVPSASTPFALLITLYFYYFVGHTLENTWGDFKFNIYYLCGMIGAILAAVLTGYGTAIYLNLTLFFAFAMLYPDMQVLLFFIIPIKVKYMALFSAGLQLIYFITGGWATKASIVFSLLNFLLFFGPDFIATVKQEMKYQKTRKAWRNNNNRYGR